jgi:hypothetical protein
MATPPHFVEVDGELHLDVSVGDGRRQFTLSDRATALLADDLEYGNRDIVPWVATKALILAGGGYLRDARVVARETAWAITGAGSGREATAEELERVGAYLTAVEFEGHAVETVTGFVRSTRLSEVVSPGAIRSKRVRKQGLREIATDL